MEQCDATLNMLRPCTINPLLSAFEAMEGHYSFNATPMAPMGTEMLMHLKPVRRHLWGYHALKAWYIEPACKHYRVLKGVTDSGAVRLNYTWKFKHHSLTVPTITATDRIVKATQYLTTAIGGQNKPPPDKIKAIEDLRALIYGSSAAPPPHRHRHRNQASHSDHLPTQQRNGVRTQQTTPIHHPSNSTKK